MLRFRDINVDDTSEVQALVGWANDYEIRHLFLRFEDRAQYERPLTFDFAQQKLRASLGDGRLLHLIEWEDRVVGEVSLDMDSSALHAPEPDTAWLGLVIGDELARGHGIGRKAMLHIEEIARQSGARRSQIGVFEFNKRARRLYESLGYRKLAAIPNFTWWKGKQWTDIRMGKEL